MESGETPWQAVIREVVEEVGWMTEDLKAATLREMKFGRLGQPEDVAHRHQVKGFSVPERQIGPGSAIGSNLDFAC